MELIPTILDFEEMASKLLQWWPLGPQQARVVEMSVVFLEDVKTNLSHSSSMPSYSKGYHVLGKDSWGAQISSCSPTKGLGFQYTLDLAYDKEHYVMLSMVV